METCPQASDPEDAIRSKAHALIAEGRQVGWEGPPFDPDLLASVRGIKVRGVMNLEQEALIHLDEQGAVEILWNAERPPTRTRFSIAHEIAHTFFPDCFDVERHRNCTPGRPGTRDAVERLCDIGAAELVMPATEFLGHLEAAGLALAGLDGLRGAYQVSREAVSIRAALLTPYPFAAVFLSHRIKPTELRAQSQASFSFIEPPQPQLRVDFMTTSKSFPGRRLPAHKSIPVESQVWSLANQMDSSAPAVGCTEVWPDVAPMPLHIEASRIPGATRTEIRIAVLMTSAT
jgi:Zn-dependent peptidase ImmA (M78 family)